ncbi:MAG TPA: tRNA guanosine(34) transglycosylase Tgt [Anaeromyxobacter sp.]|nr:tRNA guanosine(34) transglycosylase Tgt [Anaeromyxobacter sp.]
MPFTLHPCPVDPTSRARRGTLVTRHGRVETPCFMPVGTRASVTGLTPEDLRALGAQIILGNTYHLLLRPGPDAMRALGGIHRFMKWDGPVLTDSGGFQIFSLSADRSITEEGAAFRSYLDNRRHLLSPESSIDMQTALGSDVMMVLDVCVESTAPRPQIRAAMERTHRWALRSLAARTDPGQLLFAIVQGGLDLGLRAESAAFLSGHPFDGFAIGGVAVGDTRAERAEVVAAAAAALPAVKPRYLMGVGTPPDILEAVGQGVDLFDCILPTTLAWQGTAFTSTGRVRLTRSEHRLAEAPLDAACACPTCRLHSRAYLHHLIKCREPLGPRLLSVHNLTHYQDLLRGARDAIEAGTYAAYARGRLEALDRHEHDPSKRPPGRRRESALPEAAAPGAVPAARFEVVRTSQGAPAVRDAEAGEVMHPVVGAAVESERLYAAQARLAERLALPGEPLVLFDVGLGAGSNALAAIRVARRAAPGGRGLAIVSFERELGALALAASEPGAAALGLDAADAAALRAVLAGGRHEEPRVTWRLVLGDATETLPREPARADVVFWDPFSPRVNPALWSVAVFRALRARCGPAATLFTYSTATSVRAALLLAGFFVGAGDPSGPKHETTAAATDAALLARPLDARWLARLVRSSAPLPPDAAADALDAIRGHPQFR